jgi:hypothetical protein
MIGTAAAQSVNTHGCDDHDGDENKSEGKPQANLSNRDRCWACWASWARCQTDNHEIYVIMELQPNQPPV